MTTVERCEKSDLLVRECAHCQNVEDDIGFIPIRLEGTWIEARRTSVCAAECGRLVEKGDDVVLAELNAGGVDNGWCHVECTRPPNGGLV